MLLNAEIREENINTVAKVMVHAFCTFPFNLLSVYKVSFILFSTFRNMLRTTLLLQKLGRKITPSLLVVELQFLRSALSLIISYLCINFYFISYVFIRRDIALFLLMCHKTHITHSLLCLQICSRRAYYCKHQEGGNFINTADRVQYFQRYAPDKSVTDGGRTYL